MKWWRQNTDETVHEQMKGQLILLPMGYLSQNKKNDSYKILWRCPSFDVVLGLCGQIILRAKPAVA